MRSAAVDQIWELAVDKYGFSNETALHMVEQCVAHSDSDVVVYAEFKPSNLHSLFGSVSSWMFLTTATAVAASFACVGVDMDVLFNKKDSNSLYTEQTWFAVIWNVVVFTIMCIMDFSNVGQQDVAQPFGSYLVCVVIFVLASLAICSRDERLTRWLHYPLPAYDPTQALKQQTQRSHLPAPYTPLVPHYNAVPPILQHDNVTSRYTWETSVRMEGWDSAPGDVGNTLFEEQSRYLEYALTIPLIMVVIADVTIPRADVDYCTLTYLCTTFVFLSYISVNQSFFDTEDSKVRYQAVALNILAMCQFMCSLFVVVLSETGKKSYSEDMRLPWVCFSMFMLLAAIHGTYTVGWRRNDTKSRRVYIAGLDAFMLCFRVGIISSICANVLTKDVSYDFSTLSALHMDMELGNQTTV